MSFAILSDTNRSGATTSLIFIASELNRRSRSNMYDSDFNRAILVGILYSASATWQVRMFTSSSAVTATNSSASPAEASSSISG